MKKIKLFQFKKYFESNSVSGQIVLHEIWASSAFKVSSTSCMSGDRQRRSTFSVSTFFKDDLIYFKIKRCSLILHFYSIQNGTERGAFLTFGCSPFKSNLISFLGTTPNPSPASPQLPPPPNTPSARGAELVTDRLVLDSNPEPFDRLCFAETQTLAMNQPISSHDCISLFIYSTLE